MTPPLNNAYTYSSTGAGQTIYILDSGLNIGYQAVLNEFGNRAQIVYDVNGLSGDDCHPDGGHGSKVASAAAGAQYGTAKGALLKIAKITTGCTKNTDLLVSINIFNWLAANAPRGTIANWSFQMGPVPNPSCAADWSLFLDQAVTAAYNSGVIVVVAAGNDSCNTNDFSPTRISQAFVVGATDNSLLGSGKDAKASYSRTGTNISTFAPGSNVALMNYQGNQIYDSGTSFAAPYLAGLFAVACQAIYPQCSTMDTGILYQTMRNAAKTGTVTNPDGSPLTGATSRFSWNNAW